MVFGKYVVSYPQVSFDTRCVFVAREMDKFSLDFPCFFRLKRTPTKTILFRPSPVSHAAPAANAFPQIEEYNMYGEYFLSLMLRRDLAVTLSALQTELTTPLSFSLFLSPPLSFPHISFYERAREAKRIYVYKEKTCVDLTLEAFKIHETFSVDCTFFLPTITFHLLS